MRQTFELNYEEHSRFDQLNPVVGVAMSFWAGVAKARGLDPKSIISDGYRFSGLPAGHGKHWCFPSKLCMKKLPVYNGKVIDIQS